MKQGDIVLVMFPFSNLIDYKIRPALLVSGNNLDDLQDKWFCPITSKSSSFCLNINDSLDFGDFEKESFVKFSTIFTISPSRIIKQIGHLNKYKLDELIQSILKNFE